MDVDKIPPALTLEEQRELSKYVARVGIAREALETELSVAIQQAMAWFRQETGAEVDDVQVERTDITSFGDTQRRYMWRARVHLANPLETRP